MTAMTTGGVEQDLPALPRRASTAEAAAEMLRAQIAQGRLRPGAKLREEHLATAWSISRNTIREAFRLLSRDRLVEHVLNRGVFIRVVTADDVAAMYATRRLVEPLGLQPLSVTPARIGRLRRAVELAEVAAPQGEWNAVGTADIDFHRELVAAAASVHLSSMFEQLLAELRLAFLQVPEQRALHEPFVQRNRRLIELIEHEELDAAAADLSDYLHAAEQQLLEVITPQPRDAANHR